MLIDLEDVCRTVGLVLGHRGPAADDRLREDLGAESIDLLNISVTAEQKYGVALDEAAMVRVSTVRDLYHLLTETPDAGSAHPDRSA